MMRHNSTEQIGVYATAKIVAKDLGWIFREQPIADVGIDALIEQVIEGNPTGKFIALQIKSGAGNFYSSGDKIFYYASQIHYNYWLNLNLPIIMIAHFPDIDFTCWQLISETNFKRTNKQWKLEIPKRQKFNQNTLPRLERILLGNYDDFDLISVMNRKVSLEEVNSLVLRLKSINLSTDCILKITEINQKISDVTLAFNGSIETFAIETRNLKDASVVASCKSYATQLKFYASQMEVETELFAEFYSDGIFAFSDILTILKNQNYNFVELGIDFSSLMLLPGIIDNAIASHLSLYNAVKGFTNAPKALKDVLIYYSNVVEALIRELRVSRTIAQNLIENLPDS